MNSQDLKLAYKFDTGLPALPTSFTIDVFEDLGIDEVEGMEREISIEPIIDEDYMPYINWLEERLLKLYNDEKKAH